MEAGKILRRRTSAPNIHPSSEDNDEAEGLLAAESNFAEPQSRPFGRHRRYGDLSSLLRPLGTTFAVLFFLVVLIRTQTIFRPFRTPALSNVLESEAREKTLGILLHPEAHNSRPPRIITYEWNITKDFRYPDGVKKEVYLVNGLFPGPTVECRSGDKLVIDVVNSVPSEGVSIHWHGLQIKGWNLMDGAVGFTQCAIPPGETFTYEINIGPDEAGTFWWHAHSQVQRGDGMYGGLVVHRPLEKSLEHLVDENEVLLMIGDWYHRTADEVLAWYTSARGFGNEPVPDSLLVNGEGRFDCSMAVPARPVECISPPINSKGILGIGSVPSSMRIRVVNTGSLAGFTIRVDSANLTPITVDGGFPIAGSPSDSIGIIYPGERVDLSLTWLPPTDRSLVSNLYIKLDPTTFKYPNQALRPNQTFPIFGLLDPSFSSAIIESPPSMVHFDLSTANAATPPLSIPKTAGQTIVLYTKTQKLSISSNHPTGYMNRTTWSPQTPPLISLPRTEWNSNQLIPFIPLKSWVDIVLNNLDDDPHPFHLHGHSFYVVASHRSNHGWGSYNPYSATAQAPVLNLDNPAKKDTVIVPRRGYVVLRFKADNPGIWMFHCHILFHQASGMAMGFHVGEDEEHLDLDRETRDICGIQ